MTPKEIQDYLSGKAESAGYLIFDRSTPPNRDAVIFLMGTPDRKMAVAVSISGLESLQADHSLLDNRFDQACASLRKAIAA